MFGKNGGIVDLPEPRWAVERDDTLESEGHDDEGVRDRDNNDWTGGHGWSKSDMGVVVEAICQSGLPVV